jgi:hypothetical protein
MSAVGGTSMGPGSPQPVTFSPRAIGKGQPLTYNGKAGQVQADVGKGVEGTNNNASFRPRPPVRPPGAKGIGDAGAIIDASA